jgi:hypothetical protein
MHAFDCAAPLRTGLCFYRFISSRVSFVQHETEPTSVVQFDIVLRCTGPSQCSVKFTTIRARGGLV